MNFIKTSKFSVKGIDTTRYIPNVVRNLLCLCFWVELEEGLSTSSIDRHLERSERSPLLILCLRVFFLLHKNNSLIHAKKYLKNACKVIKCKKEGGINGK